MALGLAGAIAAAALVALLDLAGVRWPGEVRGWADAITIALGTAILLAVLVASAKAWRHR